MCKRKLITSLLLGAALCAQSVANANPLFDAFIGCDSQFFSYIAKNSAELSKNMPVTAINADVATIKVNNRDKFDDGQTLFKTPIKVNGLTLVGYADFASVATDNGDYYYWGFIINESMSDIAAALPEFNWIPGGGAIVTNPQITDTPAQPGTWRYNPDINLESFTAEGTAEKFLFIRANTGSKTSMLLCSVTGSLPEALLKAERPDILPEKK